MSASVARWLETFMCKQYADKFEQFGFKTLQSVCQLQPSHLHAMQIAPDHCDKILENVSVLRQTMHAGLIEESDPSDIYSSDTGSMNQYSAGNMYPNPHMIGNGYSQHPSLMGSHMQTMHQSYMNSYQGQMMSHPQGYPQYPQPIMSTHQGFGSTYTPTYPDGNSTYPPTSSSAVPMHHHMRSFGHQNPQDVADSIFHMTASYGPSRSAKYPLDPLPPSVPSHLMSSATNLAQVSGQRYPYPTMSPMYQANSASPMPIRSPASIHSNQSIHSHGSSPAQGPSPHGMYPLSTAQSPGMRSPGHQPMRSPVHHNPSHMMMSPMNSSPAATPAMTQQPSPAMTHMRSPSHTGHFSPVPQQHLPQQQLPQQQLPQQHQEQQQQQLQQQQQQHSSQHSSPSSYQSQHSNASQVPTPIQSAPPGGGYGDHGINGSSGGGVGSGGGVNHPLQSLQKLVMLPESRVVDPKSVVHYSNESPVEDDMGMICENVMPGFSEQSDTIGLSQEMTDVNIAQGKQGNGLTHDTELHLNDEVSAKDMNNIDTAMPVNSNTLVLQTTEQNENLVKELDSAGQIQLTVQKSSPHVNEVNNIDKSDHQIKVDTPMCPPKKRGRKSNVGKGLENEIKHTEGALSERKLIKKNKSVERISVIDREKDEVIPHYKRLKNDVVNISKNNEDLLEKKKAAEKEYEYHGSDDDESMEKSSPSRFSHSINNILKHSRVSDSDSSGVSPSKKGTSTDRQKSSSDSATSFKSSESKPRQRMTSGERKSRKRKSVLENTATPNEGLEKRSEQKRKKSIDNSSKQVRGLKLENMDQGENGEKSNKLHDTFDEQIKIESSALDSSREEGTDVNNSTVGDISLPTTSTPRLGETTKRKRGRPFGSKNKKPKDPSSPEKGVKRKRGRKSKSESLNVHVEDIGQLSRNLKETKDLVKSGQKKKDVEEKLKGPFIVVKGPKENPESCTVINDPGQLTEKVKNKGDSRLNNRTNFLTDATKAAMQKSAATPSSKPSTADWVCALCGKETSYQGLGDLFGPYYLSSIKSAAPLSPHSSQRLSSESPPKKKGRKKHKPEDSTAATNPEAKRPRRPSVKRSMSADVFPTESEVWLHEDCLVWCQGVYLIGNRLYGLDEALTDAKPSMCSRCRTSSAFIGCLSKGCAMKYHFLCAREINCLMNEENFTLLCPKHKDKKAKTCSKI